MQKIVVSLTNELPNGRSKWLVCHLFDIVPRLTDASGGEVVVYRPENLPPWIVGQLNPAELASINAGDTGFIATELDRTAGETDAAFAARLRLDHPLATAYELAQQRDIQAGTGRYDRRAAKFNP